MLRPRLKIFLASLWLVLTISLAAWWTYFTISLLSQSKSVEAEFLRQKNMVMWEGVTWMVLLILGGASMIYFVFREQKQSRQIRQFLATFSHELKTSLASLRLQSESLKEDLAGTDSEPLLNRLIGDAGRLQLQLENSMFIGRGDDAEPLFEDISVKEFIHSIGHQWPQLKIEILPDAKVRADRRSLESVFRNLIQNSVVHGQASQLKVSCEPQGKNVLIRVEDNGGGFSGKFSSLGQMFKRHNPGSGTGMGISIARRHLEVNRGRLDFDENFKTGFAAQILLPGAKS